jgi:hypothetical protein
MFPLVGTCDTLGFGNIIWFNLLVGVIQFINASRHPEQSIQGAIVEIQTAVKYVPNLHQHPLPPYMLERLLRLACSPALPLRLPDTSVTALVTHRD